MLVERGSPAQRGHTMNVVQNAPSSQRYRPSACQTPLKLESDERWSTAQELQTLLRYDGAIQEQAGATLFQRRRLKAGQSALRMGQAFDGLYAVRLGALKTSMTHVDGGEHVLSFPMKGDVLGFDGICKNKYLSEVIALTDCDLIRIPASELFSPCGASTENARLTVSSVTLRWLPMSRRVMGKVKRLGE